MNILDRADELVHGERQEEYGHPLDCFSRVAKLWSAILDVKVTEEEVGLCLMALKIARQVHTPSTDNLVDAAGYAETVNMVIAERERREREPFRFTLTEAEPRFEYVRVCCDCGAPADPASHVCGEGS